MRLGSEHIAALDALSTPTLGFPMAMLAYGISFMSGGTTINGEQSQPWPMAPTNDNERH